MIEIKEFEKQHEKGVVDLILPIQIEEFNIPITLEGQPDLQKIPSFYKKNCGNFWVAVEGSKIVGTLALIDIGNNICALRKMFVEKDYRGSKYSIAKKLLTTMFDWCKKKKVTDVYLGTTSKYHAAHMFYEKNGFDEISKSKLPHIFPVMEVDSKFYKFNFTA